MNPSPASRVLLIADKLPLRRALIAKYIERWAEVQELVVVLLDAEEVATAGDLGSCALIIMGLGQGGLDAPRLRAIQRVIVALHPGVPFLLVSESEDPEEARQALEVGAAAFIPMGLREDLFLAALDFILAGGSFYPTDLLRTLVQEHGAGPPSRQRRLLAPGIELGNEDSRGSPRDTGDSPPYAPGKSTQGRDEAVDPCASEDLTGRQRQVLEGLRRAWSNKQIARELDLSEATVKVHVRQVMRKLGALNRTHAAILAVANSEGETEPPANAFVPYLSSPNHRSSDVIAFGVGTRR